MKRFFAMLIATAVAAVALAGASCMPKSGSADKNPIVNPGSDYDVDLRVDDVEATLKIAITNEPSEIQMLNSLIREYNKSYPSVKVEIMEIDNTSSFNNTLRLYYQNDCNNEPGYMPDIILSNTEDMHTLIEWGILLDLQPYIDKSVEQGLLDLDDFYPEMWRLGKKGLSDSQDQYVIPRSMDRVVTHINQAIFSECFKDTPKEELPFTPVEELYAQGKIVPEVGWTWQQFLATCAALRKYYDGVPSKADGYIIDSYITWAPVYYSLVKSAGADIITDGEITVETLKPLLTELKADLVGNRYIAPSSTEKQANFEGGAGAMMFHSAYASRWYDILGDEYNVTSFPLYGSNPRIGTGIAGYGIFSRGQNKGPGGRVRGRDLAWTFINFMISPEGQDAMAEGGMTTAPIRKDMADPAENAWGRDLMNRGINMKAYTFGTEYCTPVDFYTPFKTDCYNSLLEATGLLFNRAILTDYNVDQAIALCRQTINYEINR